MYTVSFMLFIDKKNTTLVSRTEQLIVILYNDFLKRGKFKTNVPPRTQFFLYMKI